MSYYEDLQSLMRARFCLEMAGPKQGGPMVETESVDFCGQIILYWSTMYINKLILYGCHFKAS